MPEAICINIEIPPEHWIHIKWLSTEINANSNNGIYFKLFRCYNFEKLEISISYSKYVYTLELDEKTTLYMDVETFDHCFKEI